MRHKGFIRQVADETMDEAVRRLQRTGIPRKYICVEQNFRLNAEWLSRGDHLTVGSLRELGPGIEMLLANLALLCAAGIKLRSLDESWCDLTDGDPKLLVQGLADLCHTKGEQCRVLRPCGRKQPGRPPGLTKKTETKCRLCSELLATTDRTQGDILASLHLTFRTWKKYKAMTALKLQKRKNLK